GFAEQPGIGVGGRGMRLIATLLAPGSSPGKAMEVPLAVPAGLWRLAAAVLRAEVLHRCPGLDQRPVDRKMLAREQRLDLRVGEDRGQEAARDIALQQ